MKSHRFYILLFTALTTLGIFTAYAQDIGPLPGEMVGFDSDERFDSDETVTDSYVIYSEPMTSLDWKVLKKGEAEMIDKSSIEVRKLDDATYLIFKTASQAEIVIPFFSFKTSTAEEMKERLLKGRGIDLSSCVVLEKSGEAEFKTLGKGTCRVTPVRREIHCSKWSQTPLPHFFEQNYDIVSKREFSEKPFERTDSCTGFVVRTPR